MFDKNNNAYCEVNTIGREIAILRALLNMTQEQFADAILSSRVTINKLENTANPSLISRDIAFRLFYITQKTMDNHYFPAFTREKAKELQGRIESELLIKKQIKISSY